MGRVRIAAAKKYIEKDLSSDDEPVAKSKRSSRSDRSSARNESKPPARKSGRPSRNERNVETKKSSSSSSGSDSNDEEAPIVNKNSTSRSSRSTRNAGPSGKENGKNGVEASDSSSEDETPVLSRNNKRKPPADSPSLNKSKPSTSKPSTSKSSATPKKKSTEKTSSSKKKKSEEDSYEVEKILDHKIEDDCKYFLIRWKGYGSDVDSWERSRNIHCPALLAKYYEKHPEASAPAKGSKRKKKLVIPKPRQLKVDEQLDYDSDWDENEDYEVERIIDVHIQRNNKREFLIRWKGYSSKSDSWEPEENLDCEDLITKFMEKVEQVKNLSQKELRPVRHQTHRFTLMTQESARCLSKRHVGHQRAVYYDCDE